MPLAPKLAPDGLVRESETERGAKRARAVRAKAAVVGTLLDRLRVSGEFNPPHPDRVRSATVRQG